MSEQQKITFHNGKEVNLQLPECLIRSGLNRWQKFARVWREDPRCDTVKSTDAKAFSRGYGDGSG
jgi:hypothetical protein